MFIDFVFNNMLNEHNILQAFKSYDESGSVKKITCLKYLVLANMLMKSSVDPFEAQEVGAV